MKTLYWPKLADKAAEEFDVDDLAYIIKRGYDLKEATCAGGNSMAYGRECHELDCGQCIFATDTGNREEGECREVLESLDFKIERWR